MPVLESHVDRKGAEFRENHAHMESLVGDLKARLAAARAGGGEDAVKRQREQGKLPTRERVELLLDPGTPFLEIGALAAHGLYDGAAPSAGLVTGIARVRGREVMVIANDATREGRHLLPDDGEEAPARPGDRPGEPPALRVPRGLGRRLPAAAGRGLSRTATTSAASSTTKRA